MTVTWSTCFFFFFSKDMDNDWRSLGEHMTIPLLGGGWGGGRGGGMGGEEYEYAHLPSRTYYLQPTAQLPNGLVSYLAGG